jgi:hypothetical protein
VSAGNGAIFNPSDKMLIVSARIEDVKLFDVSEGHVSIAISHLADGIEIVNDNDELWWPV